ncbi:MAG: DUF4209 domain-containing protein [Spirulina sp.]
MMDSQPFDLTKEDFLNSRWQDVINSCGSKDCRDYSRAFLQQAKQAGEISKVKEQKIFELFAAVTSPVIRRESTEEFFADVFQNLTNEQIDFLTAIVPDISDAELQARIADILWSTKRNYRMAQLAIPTYIKSATELEDPENWIECFDRIERAYQLAQLINYQVETVISHIETVLDRYNGEDSSWLSEKLMRLLQKEKVENTKKYATLAETLAIRAENINNWYLARSYWEIKARWHRMEKDREKQLAASTLAAETYMKEAKETTKTNTLSYLRASMLLEKALTAFRNIQGTKEEKIDIKARVEEIHQLLLKYQKKSRQELNTIKIKRSIPCEFDIIGILKSARECVKGKEFQDALLELARIHSPVNISNFKKYAEELSKEYIGAYLMPIVMINEEGNAIARQTNEDLIKFNMNITLSYVQRLVSQQLIQIARQQVYLEHSVRISDFYPIVSNNPFVPRGREQLFAKGLYAGLTGDFFTSTHILIPQIENSVRYLLQKRGFITSGYDDRGIQNEHNLNSTLYRPEITEIFDEDTLFDLRHLLVEHSGSNLRNRMAHGLISDAEFISNPIICYLWWLVLRLCCIPILNYQQEIEQADPWVRFSGMFKDDPLFDEFVEDMAEYRRKIDAEAADREIISEENPSA